jgi:hypothetical protein
MGVISLLIVATGLKVTRWTTILRRWSFIGFVTLDTTYTIDGLLNSGPCGLNMEICVNFRQICSKGETNTVVCDES